MLLARNNIISLILISGLYSSMGYAESAAVPNSVSEDNEQALSVDTVDAPAIEAPALNKAKWGLGIGMRRADIPFAVKDDNEDTAVYDILPLMRFENDYVFLHGLEGGIHLWKNDHHQVNVYSRFRFNDVPKAFQNSVKGQSFDFGLQYHYVDGPWESDLAILSDHYQRRYGYTRIKYNWQQGNWSLTPFTELQWKSADFNNHYYGFDKEKAGAGVSIAGGLEGAYHVTSNFYLIGKFGLTRLENNVYNLDTVKKHYQMESFFGFAFYPDFNKPFNLTPAQRKNDEYLRVAYGWATPSNLGDILSLKAKGDSENNQMTSVFYGTKIADSLLTMPIDLYFTPGLVWHHKSNVQNDISEVVLAIKGFYTFNFGPRWRLGIAEGLSYVSDVTYIEGKELKGKDSKRRYENTSKLLNYLDFSLDVNLGDVFGSKALTQTWLGYSIHHRSGIFETSSMFGRIKGGSNYQTIYLQWHF